jgi:hypothetical protein
MLDRARFHKASLQRRGGIVQIREEFASPIVNEASGKSSRRQKHKKKRRGGWLFPGPTTPQASGIGSRFVNPR